MSVSICQHSVGTKCVVLVRFLSDHVMFPGCPSKCLVCSDKDQCDQCNSRTFMLQGVCVESCGDGYLANEDTRVCDGECEMHAVTL